MCMASYMGENAQGPPILAPSTAAFPAASRAPGQSSKQRGERGPCSIARLHTWLGGLRLLFWVAVYAANCEPQRKAEQRYRGGKDSGWIWRAGVHNNKKWQFYKAVILLWDFKLVKVCKAHLGGSHPFDNEILKKRTLSELLGKTWCDCISRLKFCKCVHVCLCAYKHVYNVYTQRPFC